MTRILMDFIIRNNVGYGGYVEDSVRSVYAADFVIKDGEIDDKSIKMQFSEQEFNNKKEVLIAKARALYDKMHKMPLGEFIGYRIVKE